MSIHLARGEAVNKIIKELGLKKTDVAKKIPPTGIHRLTLYDWLNDDNLEYAKIKKIGIAINFDFSVVFPDMEKGDQQKKESSDLAELKEELQYWKDEAYRLSNEIIELQKRALSNTLQIAAEPEVPYTKSTEEKLSKLKNITPKKTINIKS